MVKYIGMRKDLQYYRDKLRGINSVSYTVYALITLLKAASKIVEFVVVIEYIISGMQAYYFWSEKWGETLFTPTISFSA